MSAPGQNLVEVIVLSEERDAVDVSDDMIEEYAAFIGIDLEYERDLFWIAAAGMEQSLPEPWRACQNIDFDSDSDSDSDDVFYYNAETQQSTWDHPCDQIYKDMLEAERKTRVTVALTLDFEQEALAHRITVTNLAGNKVAEATIEAPQATTFAELQDKLMQQLSLPDKAAAQFLLRNGTMLAYSSRSRTVADIFVN